MSLDIPIVVVAFDRLHSLRRILYSLDKAHYPENARLIICIDGGGPEDVVSFANNYQWEHGDKEVLCQRRNLGLRAHILKTGDLALKYDGIILLEDDLYVSPDFYRYTQAVHKHYSGNPEISGLALYSPQYSETACLPFKPIDDGHSVYFMQLACSWGQSWLSHQWQDFRTWYQKSHSLVLQDDPSMPANVRLWPDTSWKKYFIKYNIENNKFFIYPRISYTTNFGDTGENHKGTRLWQVPLTLGMQISNLPSFDESIAKYDACYEILSASLKKMVPELRDYDFTVDLYGLRDKDLVTTDFILSRNEFIKCEMSFGCDIKPHELNIIDQRPGEHFKLGKTSDILPHTSFLGHRYRLYTNYKDVQPYYYPITQDHYSVFEKDARLRQQEEDRLAKQYPAFRHFVSAYWQITKDFLKYIKNRVAGLYKKE